MKVDRHRTAIHRHSLSRPIAQAIDDGLITTDDTVFDYGCGHGDDIRHLSLLGVKCAGWDPNHSHAATLNPAAVVNIGYVINVIEDTNERVNALKTAWSLAGKLVIVSARLVSEAKYLKADSFEDGVLTRLSTFQKFYDQAELRTWIDSVLQTESVPAAPGVFYVFRDEAAKQSFIASRYRTRTFLPRIRRSEILFKENHLLLKPLIEFLARRGRVPAPSELVEAPDIINKFGSVRRAFTIIRRAIGSEQWEKIARARATDLKIYIGLARFTRRPRFGSLPVDVQADIRAFFGTYRRACEVSDELLFSAGDMAKVNSACQESSIGKLMPSSLYVHISALSSLPPILRVYEGCARTYIGSIEGANLIKFDRREPKISYLSYHNFDDDPHPQLKASLTVPLQTFRIKFRDYNDSENPFILHRKEEFVADSYPLREKFRRLTQQEERFGLYENPELIGTLEGWRSVLVRSGVRLHGHRVLRNSNLQTLRCLLT